MDVSVLIFAHNVGRKRDLAKSVESKWMEKYQKKKKSIDRVNTENVDVLYDLVTTANNVPKEIDE